MHGSNMAAHEMQVLKRNGTREGVSFDKITKRLRSLGDGLCIDPIRVCQKVVESLYDGVTTSELDELSAQIAASMSLEHPDYNAFAGRIASSNHQKNTSPSFHKQVKALYEATDINGEHSPIVSKDLYDVTKKYRKEIEDAIDYDRDYLYDYFGFQTLKRSYLLRINGTCVERVQGMWMRVALGIHGDDISSALETYDLMSRKHFTHATPTLFNAGTPRPQLSSCFLMGMEDSIEGIFKCLTDCALVSKWAGGIGIHIHDVRARGSHIRGTNGASNGLVPLLRTFNATARFVDQCMAEGDCCTLSGPRPVAEVVYGDHVLGGDGDFHRVRRVLEHRFTGKLWHIEAVTGERMTVTGSQMVRVARCLKEGQDPHRVAHQWLDCCDLLVGDHMVLPLPTHEEDIEELTAEDCAVYGTLLRYGGEKPYSVCLPQLRSDELEEYFQSRAIPFTAVSIGAKRLLAWEPCNQFPLKPAMWFEAATCSSRLCPAIMHLPPSKASRVVDSFLKDGPPICNYQVASGMQHMLLKLGKYAALTDSGALSVFPLDCSGGTALIPVRSVRSERVHDQPVYDLVLDGSAAYCTKFSLLHHGLVDDA
jgi:hypothetical protein